MVGRSGGRTVTCGWNNSGGAVETKVRTIRGGKGISTKDRYSGLWMVQSVKIVENI